MSYYQGEDAGRAILAPRTKGPFIIAQTGVDEVSRGKNLSGKTFNGTVVGMPNNMTGEELLTFWIDKASAATRGVDADNGYNYPQLISKFIMGAVFYNQVVDVYLDENLSAEKKPNDAPYNEGAAYTGKEHSWDEAFGYFGATRNFLEYSDNEIAKNGMDRAEWQGSFDTDSDGSIDLSREFIFGHASNAAKRDLGSQAGSETDFTMDAFTAIMEGRQIIAAAGATLTDEEKTDLEDARDRWVAAWEHAIAATVLRIKHGTGQQEIVAFGEEFFDGQFHAKVAPGAPIFQRVGEKAGKA